MPIVKLSSTLSSVLTERCAVLGLQVTGEAMYTDDDAVAGCLEASLILSTQPYAKIVSVDVTLATTMAGVVRVFLAKDIPGT